MVLFLVVLWVLLLKEVMAISQHDQMDDLLCFAGGDLMEWQLL